MFTRALEFFRNFKKVAASEPFPEWRRGWDSNPRSRCLPTQPLSRRLPSADSVTPPILPYTNTEAPIWAPLRVSPLVLFLLQTFHDSFPLAGHEDEDLSHFARQRAGTAEVEGNSQFVINQSRGATAFARRVFFAVCSLHRLAFAAAGNPLVGAKNISETDQDQHDTTALLLDGDRERLQRPIVQRILS